jgi:hypothetical protein
MNVFERFWNRLRGKEPDPTIGTQIGLVAGAVAAYEIQQDDTPDYGWSGDHVSGGSDFGGGGGIDGGGAGGDAGGGGF